MELFMVARDVARSVSADKREPDFFSSQVLEASRFYLNTQSQKNQQLKVVCGGREHCQPGYRIDRPNFPFYSLEFVASGKGTVVLGDKKHTLYAGKVFSYGPGIAHIMTNETELPLVKYFVDFTGTDASKMLRKYGPAAGNATQVSSPEVIIRIFEDLIKNGQNDSSYTPLLCTAILQQLIFKIAETSIIENTRKAAAFYTYQKAREIIQKNCLMLRSLDKIAEECHIDNAYLCRLFKRFDNQSPYQYLTHMKMNLAAQRLQSPNSSIKEVAMEFGFSDPFHFSRVFKRIFGIPPSTFKSLR
jgi:AraC-like DNA-binding protein/quercetin dioxygenase-like cupin family protein